MNKIYYQHRYGGIYTVDFHRVKNTVDKSEWVVYTHVWPFEIETWIRPKLEFEDGRFRELEAGEYSNFLKCDREEFKRKVTETRKLAKG